MKLIKYIAYSLIIIGSFFSVLSIIIMIIRDGWVDYIFSWILFGPLPMIIGFLILRYLKTKINLKAINKFK